ncbi:unnamed protein product [Diatraea saccharalis]|uniref:Uncharacterized protein n=1 Tax=Diatraea saccharalis TaxID=40085 RepID=A0A9N9N0U0_9NEOP|nr:unnamed protein product [Diatraea saccharalis]
MNYSNIEKVFVNTQFRNYKILKHTVEGYGIGLVVINNKVSRNKIQQSSNNLMLSALELTSVVGLKALIPILDPIKPRLQVTIITKCEKPLLGWNVCASKKPSQYKICHQAQGTPLLVRGRVIGITSQIGPHQCGKMQIIFMALEPYHNWIKSIINNENDTTYIINDTVGDLILHENDIIQVTKHVVDSKLYYFRTGKDSLKDDSLLSSIDAGAKVIKNTTTTIIPLSEKSTQIIPLTIATQKVTNHKKKLLSVNKSTKRLFTTKSTKTTLMPISKKSTKNSTSKSNWRSSTTKFTKRPISTNTTKFSFSRRDGPLSSITFTKTTPRLTSKKTTKVSTTKRDRRTAITANLDILTATSTSLPSVRHYESSTLSSSVSHIDMKVAPPTTNVMQWFKEKMKKKLVKGSPPVLILTTAATEYYFEHTPFEDLTMFSLSKTRCHRVYLASLKSNIYCWLQTLARHLLEAHDTNLDEWRMQECWPYTFSIYSVARYVYYKMDMSKVTVLATLCAYQLC